MSTFEVVRSSVEGWDIRRHGEAQGLANFPTRELAEEAARIESEREGEAGDADAIDVRQDVFSEAAGDNVGVKRTATAFVLIVASVIALIVVISIVVSQTGFGG